ncbi:MAG: hypothetical protein ACLTXP_14845 [Odoribacter splanchnicus]
MIAGVGKTYRMLQKLINY